MRGRGRDRGDRRDRRRSACRSACSTVVAATENVQGGSAFKPGDILRASNGKTIEIINTDAEGRLVLADALHYARVARRDARRRLRDAHRRDEPRARRPVRRLVLQRRGVRGRGSSAASERSGDLACRFPLHPRYRRYIDSDFADMKNASELREGAPILAAEFLREFAGDGPWAHFDIAGPAFIQRRRPDYALDQGGTGYGVRLIVELRSGARREPRTSTSTTSTSCSATRSGSSRSRRSRRSPRSSTARSASRTTSSPSWPSSG